MRAVSVAERIQQSITGGPVVPMIEITTTKGALDDAAKQRLAGELSTLVLALEAAPMADFGDAEHMQALAWCFVNEQEVFVGGQVPAKPIYRVTVTLPEGAPGLFGPLAGRGRPTAAPAFHRVAPVLAARQRTDIPRPRRSCRRTLPG